MDNINILLKVLDEERNKKKLKKLFRVIRSRVKLIFKLLSALEIEEEIEDELESSEDEIYKDKRKLYNLLKEIKENTPDKLLVRDKAIDWEFIQNNLKNFISVILEEIVERKEYRDIFEWGYNMYDFRIKLNAFKELSTISEHEIPYTQKDIKKISYEKIEEIHKLNEKIMEALYIFPRNNNSELLTRTELKSHYKSLFKDKPERSIKWLIFHTFYAEVYIKIAAAFLTFLTDEEVINNNEEDAIEYIELLGKFSPLSDKEEIEEFLKSNINGFSYFRDTALMNTLRLFECFGAIIKRYNKEFYEITYNNEILGFYRDLIKRRR